MSTPAADDVTATLARLRRTTQLACALAAAALALALASLVRRPAAPPPSAPTAVTAPEFQLRDDHDAVRGRWSPTGFNLVDPTGRVRIGMNVGANGAPNLTFFSKTGTVRAVLGLGSEDTPALTLHDDKSRVRARVAISTDQVANVTVFDERGDVSGQLPLPASPPPAPRPSVSARRGRSR